MPLIGDGIGATQLAWTPDSRSLLSRTQDSAITLWDASSGKQVRCLQDAAVTSFVLSPDGKSVAGVWFGPPFIRLLDLASGKVIHQFGRPQCFGDFDVAWSPDGSLLASSDGWQAIQLWDPATGNEVRSLPCHRPSRLHWFPDGNTLAACIDEDQHLSLWDVARGTEVRRLSETFRDRVPFVWSPDSKILATSGTDPIIHLWDPATGKELRRILGHEKEVHSLAWSPDGKTLASASEDNTVRLWDTATATEVRRLAQSERPARLLTWSPDGTMLAGVRNGAICLWDPATGQQIQPRPAHEDVVACEGWSPDGTVVASGSWDGTIRLWDPVSSQQIRILKGHEVPVGSLAWSPDGAMLASGSLRKGIPTGPTILWDTATGQQIRQLGKKDGRMPAWSPDGTMLADTSFDSIRIWDPVTGRMLREIICIHHVLGTRVEEPVDSLAWSPDGTMVASAERGEIVLWDPNSGSEVAWFADGHRTRFRDVVWSPDSRLLIGTAGPPTHTRIWEVATKREVHQLDMYPPWSLAWSPDGKTLAMGSDLWSALSWKKVDSLPGHHGGIEALSWSPDGTILASGSNDTTVLIWKAGSRALERPLSLRPAELESCWTDLAAEDAAQAYEAIGRLARAPKQSVAFLAERLQPIPLADPRRVARLIDLLSSDEFSVRQQAAEELHELGEGARPALARALADQPTLDVRKRLEQLLSKMEGWSGEALRGRRGATVLEYIGNAEARKLLGTLAEGVREARLTQEAKASLEWLEKRSALAP
jgi:WD40 repeat protein